MTSCYLVHHKIFNLVEFYKKSKNFNEPSGITLSTAFDCGEFSGFSLYCLDNTKTAIDLKNFVDTQYGAVAYNVIYEINPNTSAGWGTFQTIQELKDRANNA